MTKWMDYLERANPDYLRARGLGKSVSNDWLAPGDDDTPHELLATAYWAYDAALMAEIADATGRGATPRDTGRCGRRSGPRSRRHSWPQTARSPRAPRPATYLACT